MKKTVVKYLKKFASAAISFTAMYFIAVLIMDSYLTAAYEEPQLSEAQMLNIKTHLSEEQLSRFEQGEPAMVYVWATWCGFCTVTTPAVNELSTERIVVGLAMQSGTDSQLRAYEQENNHQFFSLNDPTGSVAVALDVASTPTYLIIDQHGAVLWYSRGVNISGTLDLKFQLAQLFDVNG